MSLTFLYQLMKNTNWSTDDTKKEREDGRNFGKIDLKCVFCPKCLKTNLSWGFLTWVGGVTGNDNICFGRPQLKETGRS